MHICNIYAQMPSNKKKKKNQFRILKIIILFPEIKKKSIFSVFKNIGIFVEFLEISANLSSFIEFGRKFDNLPLLTKMWSRECAEPHKFLRWGVDP